jgi:hypothetical protein
MAGALQNSSRSSVFYKPSGMFCPAAARRRFYERRPFGGGFLFFNSPLVSLFFFSVPKPLIFFFIFYTSTPFVFCDFFVSSWEITLSFPVNGMRTV